MAEANGSNGCLDEPPHIAIIVLGLIGICVPDRVELLDNRLGIPTGPRKLSQESGLKPT
jgi:hypothetical protein